MERSREDRCHEIENERRKECVGNVYEPEELMKAPAKAWAESQVVVRAHSRMYSLTASENQRSLNLMSSILTPALYRITAPVIRVE